MSYGSTYIQTADNCSRVTGKITRSRKELDRRVVHYEKEFDVKLSRIPSQERSIRESMIAYSEKMRALADVRGTDPLFVRAKHIPKYPMKPPKKRRPMSFDELIGRDKERRDREERPHAAKQRPLSDKAKPTKEREIVHLPVLADRLKQNGNPKVRVSLVSASDLYDIVDFSLRSKGTRDDSIHILRMEQESLAAANNGKTVDEYAIIQGGYDKYQRTSAPKKFGEGNGTVNGDNSLKVVVSNLSTENNNGSNLKLPSIGGAFPVGPEIGVRNRPSRVKRMRLQKTGLTDIPEDQMLNHQDLLATQEINTGNGRRQLTSPPPSGMSPRSSAARLSFTAIQEVSDEQLRSNNNSGRNVLPIVVDSQKRTRRILMRDDGDVRIEVTQCPPKQDQTQNKIKAQKRFKKLIFLRDIR